VIISYMDNEVLYAYMLLTAAAAFLFLLPPRDILVFVVVLLTKRAWSKRFVLKDKGWRFVKQAQQKSGQTMNVSLILQRLCVVERRDIGGPGRELNSFLFMC